MFYDNDSYLEPFKRELVARYRSAILRREEIAGYGKPLKNALNNHLYYGLHLENGVWAFREWAPNARAIYGAKKELITIKIKTNYTSHYVRWLSLPSRVASTNSKK